MTEAPNAAYSASAPATNASLAVLWLPEHDGPDMGVLLTRNLYVELERQLGPGLNQSGIDGVERPQPRRAERGVHAHDGVAIQHVIHIDLCPQLPLPSEGEFLARSEIEEIPPRFEVGLRDDEG